MTTGKYDVLRPSLRPIGMGPLGRDLADTLVEILAEQATAYERAAELNYRLTAIESAGTCGTGPNEPHKCSLAQAAIGEDAAQTTWPRTFDVTGEMRGHCWYFRQNAPRQPFVRVAFDTGEELRLMDYTLLQSELNIKDGTWTPCPDHKPRVAKPQTLDDAMPIEPPAALHDPNAHGPDYGGECDVCGNSPDAGGVLSHGSGCYVVSEDGGGESYFDPRPVEPPSPASVDKQDLEDAEDVRISLAEKASGHKVSHEQLMAELGEPAVVPPFAVGQEVEPTERARGEADRIVCEHPWGWEESALDDLTDDQSEHVALLAAELDRFVRTSPELAAKDAEIAKLRDAIRRAGFTVMQTSGDWMLFDTSERGKELDAQTLEVANKNVDLEIEMATKDARIAELERQLAQSEKDLEAAIQVCVDNDLDLGDMLTTPLKSAARIAELESKLANATGWAGVFADLGAAASSVGKSETDALRQQLADARDKVASLEAAIADERERAKAMLHDLETSQGLYACDNAEGQSLFVLDHPSLKTAKPTTESK